MTMSASDLFIALTFIAWIKILWPFFAENSFDIHHLALTFKHSNSNSYCSVTFIATVQTFIAPFHSKQPTIQLSSWFRHSLLPFLQIKISQPNSVSDIYCSGWQFFLLLLCLRLKLLSTHSMLSDLLPFLNPACFSHPKDGNPPTNSVNQSVPQIFQPRTNQMIFSRKILKAPPLRNLGNIFRNFGI